MNKVTLYQATKTEHLTCSNHIQLMSFDNVTHIRGSDEFIPKQEVKHINIPIQKYVFSQKDWKGNVEERTVYAAFDDQLLELIQCERSKLESLNKDVSEMLEHNVKLVSKSESLKCENLRLEDRCLKLKTENDKVRNMSFWERLVFLFNGTV